MGNSSFGKGIFFAVLAFASWGILPLYWRLLAAVDPLHILSFRILFSLVLVAIILLVNKNFAWLKVFKEPKKGGLFVLSAFILCFNWGLYIWAVSQKHTIEASLGYFINPLVSIVLGLLFFREKLSALQWTAFGFAVLGVLILTVLSGMLPWISIALALSFGVYGLLKKALNLSALESLGAETLAASPLGVALLFFRIEGGAKGSVPDWHNFSYLAALGSHIWIPLAFIGFISAFPLYFFGRSAKLLPLSTLGFIQLVSPTFQFLVGLFIFHEYFPRYNFIAFSFIWLAVILYVISLRSRSGKPQGSG